MKNYVTISSVTLFMAVTSCMLNSCISAIAGQIVGQQVRHMGNDALEQGDQKWEKATGDAYKKMMQAAISAESAKVTVTGGLLSKVRKSAAFTPKDYILSPSELTQLKEILLRSREVPQARRLVSLHPKVKRTLLLFDASGKLLCNIDYATAWKRESELTNSGKQYSSASWYLPDADYDALNALPSLRAANAYSAAQAK